MVNGIVKLSREALGKVKSILFADPKLLYVEERHLINQPFFFKGTNGKGVLLIHGWTSTSYEVRRLGKYLNEEGFTVAGPMLRGHGTVPADLENIKWQDWTGDLSLEFEKLQQECEDVYIIGTSIGGNLAILLAKEKTTAKGLVLLATPYAIKFEKLMAFFASFIVLFKKNIQKYYPPTFGIATSITRLISYRSYPISNAFECKKMFEASRKILGEIQQPCLLIKSRHDHIITSNSLEEIYERIGSKIKHKKYIDKAYHTFISDIKNEYVFQNILKFIKDN